MNNKKISLRSCIVTKERLSKKDLIRVVKNNEGKVFVDLTSKANGRGAYLKRDIDVINKCEKGSVLNRHLETDVKKDIYDELRGIINGKN